MSKIKTIEENTKLSTKLASFPCELFHNISEFSDAKSLVNLSLTNKDINKELNEKKFYNNTKSIIDKKVETLIKKKTNKINDFIKNIFEQNITLYELTEQKCIQFCEKLGDYNLLYKKDNGEGAKSVLPNYWSLIELYNKQGNFKKAQETKTQFEILVNNMRYEQRTIYRNFVKKKTWVLKKKEKQEIEEKNTLIQKIDCLQEILDKKLSVKEGVSFKPIIREIKNEEELNSFLSDKNKFFGLYKRLDWLNNKEQYEAFKDLEFVDKEKQALLGGDAFKELQRKIYNKYKTSKPLRVYF